MQEFVWAFGSETEEEIEKQIVLQIEQLKQTGDVENLFHGRWAHMEALDEDEWLEHLEEHLKEIVNISGKDEMTLAGKLEADVYKRQDADVIRNGEYYGRTGVLEWKRTFLFRHHKSGE